MVPLNLVLLNMTPVFPLLSLRSIGARPPVVMFETTPFAADLLAKATWLMLGDLASADFIELGLQFRMMPSMFGGSLVLTVNWFYMVVDMGALLVGPNMMAPF